MVITCHRQHAAPRRRTCHVGVLEDIGATINTWALAIPDTKHAVELVTARWCKTKLLRAPQCGGRQFFVHPRLEHNVLCLQIRLGFPQGLVVSPQGGTTVTTDKACGVFALQGIALALQHGQLDQGLHAAHERTAFVEAVFVV